VPRVDRSYQESTDHRERRDTIVDSRRFRKQLQYRVKWKGYQEWTWEPHAHVAHCQDLVAEFHARYPDKPSPDVSLSEIAPREGGCHEQP
jgi:hypothetical protein